MLAASTVVRALALMAVPAAAAAPQLLTRSARARGAVLGGLVGDALALGGHYEYDARVLAERVGSYTELAAPTVNYGVGWGRANYHPGKVAGDMTDAGDVALMLLEHLAALPPGAAFAFDGWAAHWRAEIEERGYGSCNFQSVGRDAKGCPPGLKPGYINGASRRTLQHSSPSSSSSRTSHRKSSACVRACGETLRNVTR
jgi:hypothetical protein